MAGRGYGSQFLPLLLHLGVKLILPSFKTGEFERFAKYQQNMEQQARDGIAERLTSIQNRSGNRSSPGFPNPKSSRKSARTFLPLRPSSNNNPFYGNEHETISGASRLNFSDWAGRIRLRIPGIDRQATPSCSGTNQRAWAFANRSVYQIGSPEPK
jgi:hypothetical protein